MFRGRLADSICGSSARPDVIWFAQDDSVFSWGLVHPLSIGLAHWLQNFDPFGFSAPHLAQVPGEGAS
jgi:hypothetical protein